MLTLNLWTGAVRVWYRTAKGAQERDPGLVDGYRMCSLYMECVPSIYVCSLYGCEKGIRKVKRELQ
jgi:hypothetical protein